MGEEKKHFNSDRESVDDVNREVEPQLQVPVEPLDILAQAGFQPAADAAVAPAAQAAMMESVEESGQHEHSQLVVGSYNAFPSIPDHSSLVTSSTFTKPPSEADELAREATASGEHYCNSIT